MSKICVIHIWPERLGGNATIMPGLYDTFREAEEAAREYEDNEQENGSVGHKYCATVFSAAEDV